LLPKSIQDVYPNGSQPSTLNQAAIQSDGNRISLESGAEVVFKSTNSFEVYGTEKVTKRAVEKILELDMVKNSQVEIRFQVELACEHRDFISGKKNGKVIYSPLPSPLDI
jgi:CRISPR/Cas system-associated protein Cas7 (RAMP superfamily)